MTWSTRDINALLRQLVDLDGVLPHLAAVLPVAYEGDLIFDGYLVGGTFIAQLIVRAVDGVWMAYLDRGNGDEVNWKLRGIGPTPETAIQAACRFDDVRKAFTPRGAA